MIAFDEFMQLRKREYVMNVLREAKGNKCEAAKIANVHRNTLDRFIAECGIQTNIIRSIRFHSKPRITVQTPQPRSIRGTING